MATPKILVVEDEVIVARTITQQLQQLGYAVLGTASSGAAAIAKVAETQPDLVLMDIVLKGEMDGVTAATQIRAQRDIPVIYLTAYADDSTLQRAKLTQPFGYIVKPFTVQDLRVAIEIGMFKHQMAQELQENRDQLATLLNSMGDAVIATDAEGQITFMNPAAEVLTGWQEAEAVDKAVTEIFQVINEVTELPIENPVAKVLQDHEVVYLDDFTQLVTKTGQRIPIGDSASPLKRATGEVSGVVVVFGDMSDRRQTELLAKALAKEKELNRLKSQFVSTVSHEFRNPLAAILFSAQLLEMSDRLSEEKRRSYLQLIKSSVRSMNQLMEDVLVIGQADADRLGYNPTRLDIEGFCRNLIEELVMVKGAEHPIQFYVTGTYRQGCVDERLLRYILTNLLSNAMKYSPINAEIRFDLMIDAETDTATFQIQDQGIGIPQAEQTQLFDSFFRASNAHAVQGTGLGLAIVKRCVDTHNGQIAISSEVGVGTTITVTLPLGIGL